MRIHALILSAAALALSSGALAQSGEAESATSTKLGVKDPNRVICRTSDVLGSRLQRKRECHTAAQWKEVEMQNRQNIEHQQSNQWQTKQ